MTMIATQPTTPTAVQTPRAGASDFFQEEERCQCLNDVCNATIPRSHVITRIDPRTGRQEVKATCPYCRAIYEATRVLSDGRWKTVAFHMTPAEGFEPIGGTPRPTFDLEPRIAANGMEARCVAAGRTDNGMDYARPASVVTDEERAALEDTVVIEACAETDDADAESVMPPGGAKVHPPEPATPAPLAPLDTPDRQDSDSDVAAAREQERTIDTSTSQEEPYLD
jgi:hypothetical protein